MQVPLQITFRGLSPLPGVGVLINERSSRLERFCDRIIRCHVVIGMPHRHHRNGRRYSVHIDIKTPLGSIVVTREPDGDGATEQLGVAIREAFDSATRQLEEDGRRRRSA
ncbi:MAG TPA: HPF/RaiA family ribosome-associated protein, partial [Polyangiaceae bacterium]|nr:HPF/RaiA family ribosome-associated protein [Polyangiaceae bacterium]